MNNLLIQFAQNESKIEKLYRLYALAFPEQKKDWEWLAKEENNHAKSLLSLEEHFRDNNQLVIASPHASQIIEYVDNFLDKCLEEIESKAIRAHQAIATALRLELSMLEKRLFDIFQPTEREVGEVMDRLNRETDKHVLKLHKMEKRYQK